MVEANKKYIQLTVLVSFVVGFLIHFPGAGVTDGRIGAGDFVSWDVSGGCIV